MRKFIFAVAASFLVLTISAQQFNRQKMTPEDMAKRQMTLVNEACKLTEEQQTKVYDYYLQQNKAMQARRDSLRAAGGNQSGKRQGFNREEMEKRQAEQTKVLKSILTDEQYEAYVKALEERRARRGNRQGFGGGQRPRQHQEQ